MRVFIFLLLTISLLACSNNADNERVEELQKQVKELEQRLENVAEARVKESKNDSVDSTELQGEEKDKNTSYKLPSYKDLADGYDVDVEILNVESKTDRHFNNYHVLTLKNNYSKAITSVRIGAKHWIRRTSSSSLERLLTEAVVVNIDPKKKGEVIIRNKRWGGKELQVLSHQILEVDAVTFADGTSDESIPPRDNY